MANQTGIQTNNFAGIPSLLRIPSIRAEISDIYRRQRLVELFQWFGAWEKTETDQYYTILNQENFYSLDTTAATVTNSGTPTVTITGLSTAQSGKAVVGDTVILPAGTVARIQSVTPVSGQDTVILQSYAAGTPNLTLVAGNVVRQYSNAQEEGSEAPTPRKKGLDSIYNQVGVFRKSYAATDIVKMRSTTGSLYVGPKGGTKNEYSLGIIETYLQHRAEVAAGLFMHKMSDPNFSNTTPTVTGVNGRGVQTTRGLLQTIDVYGAAQAVTTPGTIVQADIENFVVKLSQQEGPKHYALIGGTAAIMRLSSYFKGLGSSNTSPVRINLAPNGTVIDFTVERVTYGGYELDLVTVDILDTPALFPTTGAEYKSIYAIPMGSYPILGANGTEMAGNPYFKVRYGEVREPGDGTGMEAEVRLGALAPRPTNGTNVDQTTWCTIAGIDTPMPNKFVKWTGILA